MIRTLHISLKYLAEGKKKGNANIFFRDSNVNVELICIYRNIWKKKSRIMHIQLREWYENSVSHEK